jgi:hypothetical protein
MLPHSAPRLLPHRAQLLFLPSAASFVRLPLARLLDIEICTIWPVGHFVPSRWQVYCIKPGFESNDLRFAHSFSCHGISGSQAESRQGAGLLYLEWIKSIACSNSWLSSICVRFSSAVHGGGTDDDAGDERAAMQEGECQGGS